MLRQGTLRPRLQTLHGIVGGIKAHEIDGQLAPDDYLLEKCFFRRGGRVAALHRERNRERAEMPEVEIRRKPAGAVLFRMVPGLGIAGQAPAHEFAQYPQTLPASTLPA